MDSISKFQKKGLNVSLTDNKLEVANVKDAEVAFQGTPITVLTKEAPRLTKLWLVAEIGKVCKFIEANKTLKTEEELFFTCDELLNYCKSWKAEEFLIFFDSIKRGDFGKIYERLKTAEFLDFAKKYEEKRCDIFDKLRLQETHQETKKPSKVVYTPLNETNGDRLRKSINIEGQLSKMREAGLLGQEEIERLSEQNPINKKID
jgi:hypothetical protein